MARLQQGNFVSLFTGMSQIFIAAVILTVLFVVNIIGTKQAAVVNTIICAVMTGAILAFAAFGLPKADFPYIFQTGHLFYKGVPNFMAALALLSFATGGASVICQLDGDGKWSISGRQTEKPCEDHRRDGWEDCGLWTEGFPEYGSVYGSGSHGYNFNESKGF